MEGHDFSPMGEIFLAEGGINNRQRASSRGVNTEFSYREGEGGVLKKRRGHAEGRHR